jgi:hypothetical protein
MLIPKIREALKGHWKPKQVDQALREMLRDGVVVSNPTGTVWWLKVGTEKRRRGGA